MLTLGTKEKETLCDSELITVHNSLFIHFCFVLRLIQNMSFYVLNNNRMCQSKAFLSFLNITSSAFIHAHFPLKVRFSSMKSIRVIVLFGHVFIPLSIFGIVTLYLSPAHQKLLEDMGMLSVLWLSCSVDYLNRVEQLDIFNYSSSVEQLLEKI